METIEIPYIIGHLTIDDIYAAICLFIVRKVFDMWQAHKKVIEDPNKGKWRIKTFYAKNGMRYIFSFVVSIALLLTIPEALFSLADELFGKEIAWNTLYSGIIAYAPIEIFLGIKKKLRAKATTISEKI